MFPTEFAQEPEQPRSGTEDNAEPGFAYVPSLPTPHQLLLRGAETQTLEQRSPLNEQFIPLDPQVVAAIQQQCTQTKQPMDSNPDVWLFP